MALHRAMRVRSRSLRRSWSPRELRPRLVPRGEQGAPIRHRCFATTDTLAAGRVGRLRRQLPRVGRARLAHNRSPRHVGRFRAPHNPAHRRGASRRDGLGPWIDVADRRDRGRHLGPRRISKKLAWNRVSVCDGRGQGGRVAPPVQLQLVGLYSICTLDSKERHRHVLNWGHDASMTHAAEIALSPLWSALP
jgi:hypothetical protein